MQHGISHTQLLLRPAFPEDAPAISRVDVDTWRATYKHILPAHFLAELSYQKQEDLWRQIVSSREHQNREITVVAEDYTNGSIVGFASGGPCRERDSLFRGELYTLYVLPQYHKLGLGRRLLVKVAQHLSQREMRSMLVWVLAENSARNFYESHGASLLGIKAIWVGGLPINAAAYGWRSTNELLQKY
jgi:ribosomal protein S18 acetylase RimI-like enzyme